MKITHCIFFCWKSQCKDDESLFVRNSTFQNLLELVIYFALKPRRFVFLPLLRERKECSRKKANVMLYKAKTSISANRSFSHQTVVCSSLALPGSCFLKSRLLLARSIGGPLTPLPPLFSRLFSDTFRSNTKTHRHSSCGLKKEH